MAFALIKHPLHGRGGRAPGEPCVSPPAGTPVGAGGAQTHLLLPTERQGGILENGDLFWNGELLALVALPQRLALEAVKQPQPEVHIRADRHVDYEKVAQVMTAATKAGFERIGFVSERAH